MSFKFFYTLIWSFIIVFGLCVFIISNIVISFYHHLWVAQYSIWIKWDLPLLLTNSLKKDLNESHSLNSSFKYRVSRLHHLPARIVTITGSFVMKFWYNFTSKSSIRCLNGQLVESRLLIGRWGQPFFCLMWKILLDYVLKTLFQFVARLV